jgi:copper resistance protein B
MKRLAWIALAPLAFAEPAFAQATGPSMPGMTMPAAKAPATPGPDAAPEAAPAEPEIPDTPPPPPATDHAADRYYDPAAMAAARDQLRQEHGGATVSMLMANLAEYQAGAGGGYRWEGEGRIGGDINRFVVKSEGEGTQRDGLDAAEVQGLFSHAIGPYFDLQAGVRQDFAPYARTYATVGFEGLAPYGFDLSGALFLSTRGELLARLESTYDLRLTQRLILQPRAELNFAAQDTVETRTGAGLSNAELGLRLRYEITREFAPYIGVSWDRKVGRTADYVRARGDDAGGVVFVTGIRAWF